MRKVHAKHRPVPMGSAGPGVSVTGQEADTYPVDVDVPPGGFTGATITHLLNTMAQIAGQLQAGSTFTFDREIDPQRGVSLILFLTPDRNGARLWTEPLPIDAAVYNEWSRRNIMPNARPNDKKH